MTELVVGFTLMPEFMILTNGWYAGINRVGFMDTSEPLTVYVDQILISSQSALSKTLDFCSIKKRAY